MTSERHGVASKVIATVDDLEQIAPAMTRPMSRLCTAGGANCSANAALGLKHGRLALAIDKGRVVPINRS